MAEPQTTNVEQPTKLPKLLPESQFLICGQSATRKTTTAATFPKPMLVSMWDSKGQAAPYLRRGKVKNMEYDELGTPYHEVLSVKTGKLLIRVEYYHDPDPVKPDALSRWLRRIDRLRGETNQWRSFINDSVTGMYHNAFTYMRRAVNRDDQVAIEQKMYWSINNGVSAVFKEQLYSRLLAFPMNVVVIAHIKEAYVSSGKQMMDRKVMRISAPGEVSWELASQYPEVWFTYIEKDPTSGENVFMVRTDGEIDEGLAAKSQMQIEGPVEVGRGKTHRGYAAMCEAPNNVGENWLFT
jgi:hypothetical protein